VSFASSVGVRRAGTRMSRIVVPSGWNVHRAGPDRPLDIIGAMIDLYTWTTPNGRKVSILLEELGLPYEVIPVDIGKGAQFTPEFLRISPNNKIPAIVDHDAGLSMMESGAILIYLAKKTGRLFPADERRRWQALEWLMMQMGSVGPMLGQAHHFNHFHKHKSEYARQRYVKETARIYGVLDRRLAELPYLAREYSIADIATWPWIARYEWQSIDWAEYPNLKRWYREIAERPAVQRGYDVPRATKPIPLPD
jgi:GST-like protein